MLYYNIFNDVLTAISMRSTNLAVQNEYEHSRSSKQAPDDMTLRVRLFIFLIFSVLISGYSSRSNAHPHNWIDLKSDFTIDSQFRLTQIKQIWKFDNFYSMITLADVLNEHKDEEKGLNIVARKMITDLADYNYFSLLTINGRSVPLPAPTEYRLFSEHEDTTQFLKMEILFDLAPQIPIGNRAIEWQVFDPTYYIAMMHSESSNISVTGNQSIDCSSTVEQPNPTEDIMNYAMGLDQNQRETNGLGKYFAEKIRISCNRKY